MLASYQRGRVAGARPDGVEPGVRVRIPTDLRRRWLPPEPVAKRELDLGAPLAVVLPIAWLCLFGWGLS